MNVDVVGRIRNSIKNEPPTKLECGPDHSIRSRPGGQSFNFQYLYQQEHTNLDLFVRHVEPMIDMFFSGYNVCVMAYGESDSGKSYTLAGDSSFKSGVVPLALSNIFRKLETDEEPLPGGARKTSSRCLIRMFEIYDEKIRDLMVIPTSSTDYLHLHESPEDGTYVKALSSVQVSKAAEATTLFREGWTRRTASMINYEEAGRKSAVFFQVELNLATTDNPLPNCSKFTFVDLPGAEKLVFNSTDLRLREGTTLNNSLFAFSKVVADLASKPRANRVVNYRESYLTRLLEDELGGNCKTRVIVCVRPHPDADILAAVLRTASQIAVIKNFPIINDFFSQQLITQYRARIVGYEMAMGADLGLGQDPKKKMTKEVKDELRRVQNENLELRDKNERLLQRMEHLQHKFGHVAHDRTDISTQLLTSEEDKLKVSKALVEMEIENNKLREQIEEVKFEMTNKILKLENDLLEAQMSRDKYYSDAARLRQVEQERKELADEYVALKASFLQMQKDYDLLVAKNEELSMELINLVNAKATLLRQMDNIELIQQGKVSDPNIEIERIKAMIARNKPPTPSGYRRAVDDRKEIIRLSKGEVDDTVDGMRNHYDEEQRKMKIKIGELIRELQDVKTLAQNRLQDMSENKAKVLMLRNEKENLETQLNRLQHKLKNIYEEYKNRLIRYVENVAQHVDTETHGHASGERLREYALQMIQDLQSAHEVREAQLSSAAQTYKRKNDAIRKKHEELLVAYSNLRHQALECGDPRIQPGPDIDELYLKEMDERSTQKEITRLKNELGKTRMQLAQVVGGAGGGAGTVSPDQFQNLRSQLRDFTQTTQMDLEGERADLLIKNQMLQEQLGMSQNYIDKHLGRYRDEIKHLRQSQGLSGDASPLSFLSRH